MMDSLPENVLIESLDALEEGRSIESILRSYPDQAEMLRPILQTAASLAAIKIAHSLEGQARSRDRFLEAATSMRAAGAARRKSPLLLWRRLALTAGLLVMIIFLFSAGVIFASQSAVPGDALYSTKRVVEDLRLSLVQNTALFETLSARFEAERLTEIEELIDSDRSIDGLIFSGELEAMDGDIWIVAGLPLQLTETSIVSGQLQPGQQVEVVADLHEGKLIAVEIKSVQSDDVVPEPKNQITPTVIQEDLLTTPEVHQTPIARTPLPSSTPDTIGEGSETPAFLRTPSPSPSPTPTEETTQVPEDNTNFDDEADDNGNESEGPGGDEDTNADDASNSNENNESNESEGGDNQNEEEDNENEEENENDGSGSDDDSNENDGDDSGGDGGDDDGGEDDSNENDRSGGD